jgi:hypothetical protein
MRALFHDNFPSKLFLKQFQAAGTESVYDATFQKQGSKTQRDLMADESGSDAQRMRSPSLRMIRITFP